MAEHTRSELIGNDGYYLQGDPETAYFSANKRTAEGKYTRLTFSPDGEIASYSQNPVWDIRGFIASVEEGPKIVMDTPQKADSVLDPLCHLASQMARTQAVPFLPSSPTEKRVRAEGQVFLNTYCNTMR